MKKTQRKDAVRNIRHKVVSWISIVIVTTMAVGCFLGAANYRESVARQGETFYRAQGYKDLDVNVSLGVTEEDIQWIRGTEGVADAEGTHLVSAELEAGNTSAAIEAVRLTERINTPEVTEGELPKAADECALSEHMMKQYDISVGDTVRITAEGRFARFLAGERFTVTAAVIHPEYLLSGGANVALLPDAAFDTTLLGGGYMRALVLAEAAQNSKLFTEEYYTDILPAETKVRELMEGRAVERAETVRMEAGLLLQTAKAVADEMFARPEEEFAAYEAEILGVLGQVMPFLTSSLGMTADMNAYDTDWPVEKKKEFIYGGIAEAEELLKNLTCRVLVQNRRFSTGYTSIQTNTGAVGAAAGAFALLFILVGALVCFSTITIIVDEQKRMIGATKAFGFFNREIFAKYLVFSISAVLAGIFLGFGLSLALEAVFSSVTGGQYVYGKSPLIFPPQTAIPISLAEIAVAVLATFIACRALLKQQAVQLMSGESAGKVRRRSKESKGKGSLYSRLILRNMKTEAARVGISIFIIACSCALIGVGFSLKFAFSGMLDKQLHEIQRYDLKVWLPEDADETVRLKAEEVLKEYGTSFTAVTEEGGIYRTGDLQEYAYFFTAGEEVSPAFFHLKDAAGKELSPPEDGILVQQRISEKTGLKEGDTVILYDSTLEPRAVRVSGVFENRIGRTLVMSPAAYRSIFGREPQENRYLVELNGADRETVKQSIAATSPGFLFEDEGTTTASYNSLSGVYDMIVLIMTFLAVFMSVFVLLNLTNIFVNRKKKELIIMRLNGFSYRQTVGYLLRETLMTILLGFLLAVVVGGIAARIMIIFIEPPDGMFDRAFQPLAWVIAICMEAVFAAIINRIAFRRVKKLNLTDWAA